MTAVVAIAAAAALALLGPALAARGFEGRASPRTVATFHVLALVEIAALPLVAAACVALLPPDIGHGVHGPCRPAALRWAAVAFAFAYLARLAWSARSALRATRRPVADASLAAAERGEAAPGIPMVVLPTERPVAYAAASDRGPVVVSRGLLRLLRGREREAALAHEVAHLRLRHHRLLLFGQTVHAALGPALPPVRRAWRALRRELETVADEEAARAVGDPAAVARALARVVLAGSTTTAAPALGNPEDLEYRIDRLLAARPRVDREALAAGATVLLGIGLIVAQCAALHPASLVAGVATCTAWLAWLAGRVAAPRPG
jgi:Zn-dependent protease with chaperone function